MKITMLGNMGFKIKSFFSLRKCSYWIVATLSSIIKDCKQICFQMSLKPNKVKKRDDEASLNRISGIGVTSVVFAPGSRLIACKVSGAVNVTPTTFIK